MYNIVDFGAVADGKTLCTAAIQKAIDTCAQNGGGRVVVPQGRFYTGTIWLRDHVELHLEIGSVLIASTDLADYNAEDAYPQNFGSKNEQWRGTHLILAIECTDVAITGLGTIDGNGDFYFGEPAVFNDYYWRDGIARSRDQELLRPGQTVCFIESSHITLEGITLRNTTCWSCFFHGCEVVTVHAIKVFNSKTAGNTDGIDLDCCRFVTVSDCIIHTGDDAITVRCDTYHLKDKTKRSEHITITNCTCGVSACAVRIGVGSGIIRHVRISNLTILRAAAALQFNTSYGGGGAAQIEDVNFSNISMENTAFLFQIKGEHGTVRRVTVENVRAYSMAGAHVVTDGDYTVEDITFRNVDMILCPDPIPMTARKLAERGTHPMYLRGVQGALLERVRVIDETEAGTWSGVCKAENCQNVEVSHCNFEMEEVYVEDDQNCAGYSTDKFL